MATLRIEYLGGLRTQATHLKSGNTIVTDAPVDNNGLCEAFSPTDLVATAYISCMLTIIGIYCDKNGLKFKNGHGSVNKIMASGPRRVSRLEIELELSGNGWSEEEQQSVIRAAEACPVAKSVNEEIELEFKYSF